jgi:hypothetical protein
MIEYILGVTSVGKSTFLRQASGVLAFPCDLLVSMVTRQVQGEEFQKCCVQIEAARSDMTAEKYGECKRLNDLHVEVRKVAPLPLDERGRQALFVLSRLTEMFSHHRVMVEGEALADYPLFPTIAKNWPGRTFLLVDKIERVWPRYEEKYPEKLVYPAEKALSEAQVRLLAQCQAAGIRSGTWDELSKRHPIRNEHQ